MQKPFPALRSRPRVPSQSSLRVALTVDAPRTKRAIESVGIYSQSVENIIRSLNVLGHHVDIIDVGIPIGRLVDRLTGAAPDLIFNTAQGTGGRSCETFYPLLFEQLGIPFTGSDAHVCTVARDKSLAKHVLSAYGVPVAMSKLIAQAQDLEGHELRYPLVLKPNYGDSALGTRFSSIVANATELRVRALEMLKTFPNGVLLEEYIDGLNLSVPYLEGDRSGNGGILEPACHIESRAGKATTSPLSPGGGGLFYGSQDSEIWEPMGGGCAQRVHTMHVSRVVLEALEIRDVARLDYRVDRHGGLYFLQADVLPRLDALVPVFAGAAMGYPPLIDVVDAVVRSASRRYGLGGHRHDPSIPMEGIQEELAAGL